MDAVFIKRMPLFNIKILTKCIIYCNLCRYLKMAIGLLLTVNPHEPYAMPLYIHHVNRNHACHSSVEPIVRAHILSSPKGNLLCGPPSSSGPYTREKAVRCASPTIRRLSWRRSLKRRSTSHLRRGNDWPRCCISVRDRWTYAFIFVNVVCFKITRATPHFVDFWIISVSRTWAYLNSKRIRFDRKADSLSLSLK